MKIDPPAWLDESHPNYLRWKRSRDLSIERGKFVQSVVNQKNNVYGLTVLDLGSGEGGAAKGFSKNNFVVSLDLSLIRLKRQNLNVISKEGSYPTEKSVRINDEDFSLEDSLEMTDKNIPHSIKRVNGNALQLPFANNSFDLIIIQDVIEHLTDVNDFYTEVRRVLKSNGTIYLSTPNKFSILNFIADPHFGLPAVSVLSRESIKKYFLKYFRKDDYNRDDIAQLLSLKELIKLFQKDFEISLNTKFSVKELFNGNKGIVWSNFHLKFITLCKLTKLDTLLIKIANDKIGVLNKYFTPTFYIILKKIKPLITRINTK
jgi:ubiquinone/menaquinone biosynthesis C-methylase UbiE